MTASVTSRLFKPLTFSDFVYQPSIPEEKIDTRGKKVVVLTDGHDNNTSLGICVGDDMECQGRRLHDCIICSHCGGVSSRCVGRHHADSSMGTYRRGLSGIFHTLANQYGILGT